MSDKKIVIVGATSAIAEQCARIWVKAGAVDLVLVGRDIERLEAVAADLRVRSPQSKITPLVADFVSAEKIRRSVAAIVAEGAVDIALIAHGSLPDQAQCQKKLRLCAEALQINGVSPVLYAEAFAGHMEAANSGSLAIISSVAADRGRKSNYVYGAAKGLVSRYAQGLEHRLAQTAVRVTLIKPGPTDTPMTAHLKRKGAKLASAEAVAQRIVAAIAAGKPLVYAPRRWALIMLIIRHLPGFIFNRLDI